MPESGKTDVEGDEALMADREKVIKGFTVCSEHGLLNGEDCHGHYEYTDNLADIIKANDYSKQCPYNGCKTGCVKTLAKDALAMLKEQETANLYKCPNCGTWVSAENVVRCKDCRHCDEIDMYGYVQCDKAETHEPDFYCADGERRE